MGFERSPWFKYAVLALALPSTWELFAWAHVWTSGGKSAGTFLLFCACAFGLERLYAGVLGMIVIGVMPSKKLAEEAAVSRSALPPPPTSPNNRIERTHVG